MMRREEKRRKFHEALLNTLYPPKPQQPQESDKEKETPAITSREDDFDVNLIPDDYGLQESGSSTSDDNSDNECEQQKLTRAQRKRLRKKKIKEDVSRRRHIIGPLLPSSSKDTDDDNSVVKEDTPDVRQNAELNKGRGHSQSKKLKQRRMAKRLAKEKLKCCDVEKCAQGHSFESADMENCVEDRKSESNSRISSNA